MMLSTLFIQRRAALLAYADLAIATYFVPNPYRPTSRTNQLHIGQRNPALLFGNAACNIALRIRAHVLFHHHHVLHQELVIVGKHAQHAPFLTLVAAGDNLHVIVAPDIDSLLYGAYSSHKVKVSRFLRFKVSMSNHSVQDFE